MKILLLISLSALSLLAKAQSAITPSQLESIQRQVRQSESQLIRDHSSDIAISAYALFGNSENIQGADKLLKNGLLFFKKISDIAQENHIAELKTEDLKNIIEVVSNELDFPIDQKVYDIIGLFTRMAFIETAGRSSHIMLETAHGRGNLELPFENADVGLSSYMKIFTRRTITITYKKPRAGFVRRFLRRSGISRLLRDHRQSADIQNRIDDRVKAAIRARGVQDDDLLVKIRGIQMRLEIFGKTAQLFPRKILITPGLQDEDGDLSDVQASVLATLGHVVPFRMWMSVPTRGVQTL